MHTASFSPLRLYASFALTILAVSLAGCGRQDNNNPHPLAASGRQAFRVACADDLQKFCANDQRKRRCLQSNYAQLSDNCKTALAESHGGGAGGGGGGGGGHRLRAVCTAEIQKYCAGENRVRRCLRNNLENLGPDCKAALSQGRGNNDRNNDADGSDDD